MRVRARDGWIGSVVRPVEHTLAVITLSRTRRPGDNVTCGVTPRRKHTRGEKPDLTANDAYGECVGLSVLYSRVGRAFRVTTLT